MAARKSKAEGVGPKRPAPFVWATAEQMAAMSDAEWNAYRAAMSRYSNAVHDTRAKTASQNALLMALYFRELRRWEADPASSSKPQPPGAARLPSPAQIGKLAALLGHPGKEALISYVEFANAVSRGFGYYPGWSNTERHGKVLLSSGHWRQAIDLALRGRNDGGDVAFYTADAWGHDEAGLGIVSQIVDGRSRFAPCRALRDQLLSDRKLSHLPRTNGDIHDVTELPNKERPDGRDRRQVYVGFGTVKVTRRSPDKG